MNIDFHIFSLLFTYVYFGFAFGVAFGLYNEFEKRNNPTSDFWNVV